MSAILLLYTVDRERLPGLASDEGAVDLDAWRVGDDYGWSGYCMLYVLMYLEEQEITFGSAGEYTVLTRGDLAAVDPDRHDLDALGAFLLEEMDDVDDEDPERDGWTRQAGLESLQMLHRQVGALGEGDVLLLRIC